MVSTDPSIAFWLTLGLYAVTSVLYVGAFVDAPKSITRAARWTLGLAFLAHAVEIGWRGVEGVHPGTSVREALGFLAWVIVGGYLLWRRKLKLSVVGAFVAPAALVILAAARLSPTGDAMEELGTLGRVHISLATVGVALFALATSVSVVYVLAARNLREKKFGGLLFRKGVALESLDRLSHRLVLIGFPIFTLAMALGVVWVSRLNVSVISRPEYPFALVTWLCFGGLLVGRRARGWRGRRAAFVTILGFSAALLVLSIYFVRRAFG